MNKDRFLEIQKLLTDNPDRISEISEDERKQFQQYLVDKGYDLPEHGVDGVIGTETINAMNNYIASDQYKTDFTESPDTAGPVADPVVDDPDNPDNPSDNLTPLQRIEMESAKRAQADADKAKAINKFENDRDRFGRDIYNISQAGVDLSRLASSLGQIRSGQRQRQEAVRPQLNQRELSPELRASYQRTLPLVNKGFSDRERAALAEQNLYGYANALNSVGALGQGQSSIAGVGAQRLHGLNLKNNLNTAVADAQARMGNLSLNMQAGNALAADRDSLYRTSLQYDYLPKLREYLSRLGEAGITERQGRSNLDKLLSQAPYRAHNLAHDYYGTKVQTGAMTPQEYMQNKQGRAVGKDDFFKNLANKLRNMNVTIPPESSGAEGVFDDVNYQPYNPSLGPVNDYQFNV